uniref:EF-hand domain-containing protein n=1 Tax=Biomphalaria glabrata TaxID=6526 RepID=A0A2C9JXK0_BIOGL
MKTVVIIALAVFTCVLAQGGVNLDRLFNQYAGSDSIIQLIEFSRFWGHFDDDGDGQVTKQEFDRGWREEGFPNPQHAPLFFLEMDRVADEVLNSQDYPHIFHLFDENGDGGLSLREFRYNWEAFFN